MLDAWKRSGRFDKRLSAGHADSVGAVVEGDESTGICAFHDEHATPISPVLFSIAKRRDVFALFKTFLPRRCPWCRGQRPKGDGWLHSSRYCQLHVMILAKGLSVTLSSPKCDLQNKLDLRLSPSRHHEAKIYAKR